MAPRRLAALALLAATACGGEAPGAGAPPRADLVLHDAKVWTADAARPSARAVAIRGERILAVGSDAEALALRGPGTRAIDLDGAFVAPGFNDSHVHFAWAARFLEFELMNVSSQEEFARRVGDAVARIPEGDWILGGFWGAYDRWRRGSAGGEGREPFAPDLGAVEEIAPAHPIFLTRFDGAEFAANAAALRAVGLDPAAPRAEGVEFLGGGRMRGEGVMPLFSPVLPRELSREQRLAQSRRALAAVRAHGVTSLSDMSDDAQLEIYRELRAAGELTVRVHFRPHLERVAELAARGVRVGTGDAWIRLGAVKGHVDGIMGDSTARFFEPYAHQPGNRGRWRRMMQGEDGALDEKRLQGAMLAADAAGIQLSVHAIGDEANALLLDHLEQLAAARGRADRRFRLVHAQVMRPRDIARLGRLGVVAEVQPFHLSDDMRWMEERIGRARCRGAYAFRSIRDSGAVLAFGSDWPGTAAAAYPIDPLLGIYAAVTRQTVTGQPAAGWFPEERLPVEDALRAYTLGSAFASFEEAEKGSIAPGKLADLAVLSGDPRAVAPRRIPELRVLYTVVGGRVVYSADGRKESAR